MAQRAMLEQEAGLLHDYTDFRELYELSMSLISKTSVANIPALVMTMKQHPELRKLVDIVGDHHPEHYEWMMSEYSVYLDKEKARLGIV